MRPGTLITVETAKVWDFRAGSWSSEAFFNLAQSSWTQQKDIREWGDRSDHTTGLILQPISPGNLSSRWQVSLLSGRSGLCHCPWRALICSMGNFVPDINSGGRCTALMGSTLLLFFFGKGISETLASSEHCPWLLSGWEGAKQDLWWASLDLWLRKCLRWLLKDSEGLWPLLGPKDWRGKRELEGPVSRENSSLRAHWLLSLLLCSVSAKQLKESGCVRSESSGI